MNVDGIFYLLSVVVCLGATGFSTKWCWEKDGEVDLLVVLCLLVTSFTPLINFCAAVSILSLGVLCCFIYLYDKYRDMLVIRKDTRGIT